MLPFYLSTLLSFYISAFLPLCPSTFLPFYRSCLLSAYLSTCPPLRLSICLRPVPFNLSTFLPLDKGDGVRMGRARTLQNHVGRIHAHSSTLKTSGIHTICVLFCQGCPDPTLLPTNLRPIPIIFGAILTPTSSTHGTHHGRAVY